MAPCIGMLHALWPCPCLVCPLEELPSLPVHACVHCKLTKSGLNAEKVFPLDFMEVSLHTYLSWRSLGFSTGFVKQREGETERTANVDYSCHHVKASKELKDQRAFTHPDEDAVYTSWSVSAPMSFSLPGISFGFHKRKKDVFFLLFSDWTDPMPPLHMLLSVPYIYLSETLNNYKCSIWKNNSK